MHVLLEDSMKRRLAARGVRTPALRAVRSAADAVVAAHELGGDVVVKALVGVGDRGRKNLVRAVGTPDAAGGAAEQMLGTVIDGQVIDRVLVEATASPGSEHFIGYDFDYFAASAVLLHGPGGSGVEERGTLGRVRSDSRTAHRSVRSSASPHSCPSRRRSSRSSRAWGRVRWN